MTSNQGELQLEIPSRGTYHLTHVVMDVNGTLCLDGELMPGVRDALGQLAEKIAVHLITADTHGTMGQLQQALAISVQRLTRGQDEAEQKALLVRQIGTVCTVAVGNGANDALMLKEAAIGIAILGPEGLAQSALLNADVVVPDILTAISLLLKPKRLIATLRR